MAEKRYVALVVDAIPTESERAAMHGSVENYDPGHTPERVANAQKLVAALGEEAVPELLAELLAPRSPHRDAVGAALRDMGERARAAVPALLPALARPESGAGQWAEIILKGLRLEAPAIAAAFEAGAHGAARLFRAKHAALALPLLARAAESTDRIRRGEARRARKALAPPPPPPPRKKEPSDKGIAALIASLAHPREENRRAAARKLGESGPRAIAAAPALRAILAGDETGLRDDACAALGAIEGEGAVDALGAIINDGKLFRSEALRALVRIGTPRAIAALLDVLPDADDLNGGMAWPAAVAISDLFFEAERRLGSRAAAADALAGGDEARAEVFLRCGEQPHWNRGSVNFAQGLLALFPHERTRRVPRLVQELALEGANDEHRRYYAAKALREMGPAAIPPLEAALAPLRAGLAGALGERPPLAKEIERVLASLRGAPPPEPSDAAGRLRKMTVAELIDALGDPSAWEASKELARRWFAIAREGGREAAIAALAGGSAAVRSFLADCADLSFFGGEAAFASVAHRMACRAAPPEWYGTPGSALGTGHAVRGRLLADPEAPLPPEHARAVERACARRGRALIRDGPSFVQRFADALLEETGGRTVPENEIAAVVAALPGLRALEPALRDSAFRDAPNIAYEDAWTALRAKLDALSPAGWVALDAWCDANPHTFGELVGDGYTESVWYEPGCRSLRSELLAAVDRRAGTFHRSGRGHDAFESPDAARYLDGAATRDERKVAWIRQVTDESAPPLSEPTPLASASAPGDFAGFIASLERRAAERFLSPETEAPLWRELAAALEHVLVTVPELRPLLAGAPLREDKQRYAKSFDASFPQTLTLERRGDRIHARIGLPEGHDVHRLRLVTLPGGREVGRLQAPFAARPAERSFPVATWRAAGVSGGSTIGLEVYVFGAAPVYGTTAPAPSTD